MFSVFKEHDAVKNTEDCKEIIYYFYIGTYTLQLGR